MNLSAIDLRLNSFHATASTSTSAATSTSLFNKTSIHFIQFRVFRKRRRFKFNVRSCINYPFENLFHSLPNPFASTSSLDLLAPALGLFSGLAIYASQSISNKPPPLSCIGNWVLFTSPTPFNRFVILRCPSISLEGSDFLESVNEKLVKEDRHFVRLNNGRIQVRGGDDERASELEAKLKYQRACVNTEDGGVISLDWPANLDLLEEHGLDTTVLLVPGTAEGSMEKGIRSFVCEALENGFFPVVMNPRGCSGSPLTTARLFTAADSDDICTAIQFINNARPWTTLMGVGWGYGANMLTKYLAEVREGTPLTAVTCIDNPFDLEEATRSSPHHIALDQKLTNGLIDILRSNKELFQGRAKGFDMEKALLAKSVRDFEEAISMVSYGFKAIEDFYAKSSTQSVVGNLKIPVLFIQNDNGTLPTFSIPRNLIAENPYTSLLFCSCPPSTIIASGRAAEYWCQHLTIEWLIAVELGLLKGHHPLLKDVDVTINPSEGLALVEARATNKDVKVNKLLDYSRTNGLNIYSVNDINEVPEKSNDNDCIHQSSRRESQIELGKEELQEMDNGALQQTGPVDAELVKEEEANPLDSERSQVLQSTQVVMNMLDVTMPGTLTEEEKKKVLTAVGKGETLMKALQDAVPEDVRGNLLVAVSGFLHAEGTNLKLDGLLGIGKIPNVTSEFKSKIQEVRGISSAEGLYKDPHRADQVKRVDNLAEGSDNAQPDMAKSDGGLPLEKLQKSDDVGQSQSMNGLPVDISSSVRKNTSEFGNNHENDGIIKEKVVPYPNIDENGSETSANSSNTSQAEKTVGSEEYEDKVEQDDGVSLVETKCEDSTQKIVEKALDPNSDRNKTTSANVTEEAVSHLGSSSEAQSMEKEGNDNQKRENKILQPATDLNPATFSVSQALDALTGMDDSTQMAVNNVFGVIENMITQLEEENDDENDVKEKTEVKDEKIDNSSEKQRIGSHERSKSKGTGNDKGLQSPASSDPSTHDSHESGMDIQHEARTERVESEHNQNPILCASSGPNNSHRNKITKSLDVEKKRELVGSKLLSDHSDELNENNFPLYNPVNLYGDSIQNEYLSRYPMSKLPNAKSLDLDTTTALLLDYFPEEGQWKLLEQAGNFGDSIGDFRTCVDDNIEVHTHSFEEVDDADKFIEPAYLILDTDKQQEPIREYKMKDHMNENVESTEVALTELMRLVKNIMLNSLKVEVERKLSPFDRKEMESKVARDIKYVANAVSLAVGSDSKHIWYLDDKHYTIDNTSKKFGTLQGENIIRAITSAVQSTSFLRKVLPVGVIVGSSLAALRKYFNVSTENDNSQKEPKIYYLSRKSGGRKEDKAGVTEICQMPFDKNTFSNGSVNREVTQNELKNLNNGAVMVGAVTAALGASALLLKQSDLYEDKGISENMSKPLNEKEIHQKEPAKPEGATSEKNQNNIVTSLAEKAMSVAGPVVPTKEDGEVDQERLVTMLADLGQRGGMLKLVGKIALLWAGLRGAMSLTDRLILFLRIADRPLFQRILGFVGMVLVLWSPVVVPLLPTLVQSWTTNNPSRIAELACIIGLYTAVMILVVLWGRRIRGYENPLERYGLDMTSLSKVQNFLKGFIAGLLLVLLLQSVKALLGCASFSWPSSIPSPLNGATWLRVCGKSFMLACRGIITATAIVLVEELLFRSWLPEEIATDLGYHRGIIISGLAFSLFQRSPEAIPGLWLFSLALAGVHQRSQGSLSVPIGLRAGIMASSFVLQNGGLLTYNSDFPVWVTGTHPFQPFSGVFGLAFSLLLVVILYPRQPLVKEEIERTTGE